MYNMAKKEVEVVEEEQEVYLTYTIKELTINVNAENCVIQIVQSGTPPPPPKPPGGGQ
jgi:hypothetical protein